MKLTFKSRHSLMAELVIEAGNTIITEDVAMSTKDGWKVADDVIENLISVTREMCLFNNLTDVQIVERVYNSILSKGEREEFKELIND